MLKRMISFPAKWIMIIVMACYVIIYTLLGVTAIGALWVWELFHKIETWGNDDHTIK